MADVVTRCDGADGSFFQLLFTPGQRPDFSRSCDAEEGCTPGIGNKRVIMECTINGVTSIIPMPYPQTVNARDVTDKWSDHKEQDSVPV